MDSSCAKTLRHVHFIELSTTFSKKDMYINLASCGDGHLGFFNFKQLSATLELQGIEWICIQHPLKPRYYATRVKMPCKLTLQAVTGTGQLSNFHL